MPGRLGWQISFQLTLDGVDSLKLQGLFKMERVMSYWKPAPSAML